MLADDNGLVTAATTAFRPGRPVCTHPGVLLRRNEAQISQDFVKFITAFPDQIFPEVTKKRFSVIRFPTDLL